MSACFCFHAHTYCCASLLFWCQRIPCRLPCLPFAEVRSGDLIAPLELATGDKVVFTIVEGADGTDNRIGVNYDEFTDDASVGDTLLVDGGIMSLEITSIQDTGTCVRPGQKEAALLVPAVLCGSPTHIY